MLKITSTYILAFKPALTQQNKSTITMSGLKNLLITLLITIFITAIGGFMVDKSAEAMTQSFQWNGKTGYSARGKFSYDEAKVAKTIVEQGAGKTNSLKSLIVTFYNPSGEPISTYENVINGIASGNYFEFHFDRVKQKLFGSIDLGGEFAGEMYLKGEVDRQLSLIEVDSSSIDRTVDKDFGAIVETQNVTPLQEINQNLST